ncbi:MAG: FkbM family methyltransferase [Planctomycetota bacterium]
MGGFDPDTDSVAKHFYDKGWSGANVEPIERFHRKCEKQRPRDWNIKGVVGAAVGTVSFNEWGDSGLSTYRETFDENAITKMSFSRTIHSVPMTTLAEITSQLGPLEIEFLKIDVKGAERDVLLGGE